MADDLYNELNDTLQWINIRTRLILHLTELANTGDRSAQDQLNFLVPYWTYPVPMQKQIAEAKARGHRMAGIVITLLELLEQRGERLPHIRELCRQLGMEMPQSIAQSRTITVERCKNCGQQILTKNEHLSILDGRQFWSCSNDNPV